MSKIKKRGLIISTVASLFIVGCGGGSSSTTVVEDSTSDKTTQTGYFVDSAVVGADYDCLADGEYNKVTEAGGAFHCEDMSQVRFRVGKLVLGEIEGLPEDGYVLPQDLAKVDREEIDNEKVLAIAKLLQSIDKDGDATNGITIPPEVKKSIAKGEFEDETDEFVDFKEDKLHDYLANSGNEAVDDEEAKKHLEHSMSQLHKKDNSDELEHKADEKSHEVEDETKHSEDEAENRVHEAEDEAKHSEDEAENRVHEAEDKAKHSEDEAENRAHEAEDKAKHSEDEAENRAHKAEDKAKHSDNKTKDGDRERNGVDLGEKEYLLSQELRDAIAYMGNEERLAHDVYMKLYAEYSDGADSDALYSLYNVATKSETKHISTVQSIVQKYSITPESLTNIVNPVASSSATLSTMPEGKFGIEKIQALYDTLVTKGKSSPKDALEVGCMVEVTDINDLNNYIDLAEGDGAEDIVDAFTKLRDASYNHYWAFDRALKNMGSEDGCCGVGDEYCHNEYPKNEHDDKEKGEKKGEGKGGSSSKGSGQGSGQGQGNGGAKGSGQGQGNGGAKGSGQGGGS